VAFIQPPLHSTLGFLNFFIFHILLLYWGYVVTLTKVLTIYHY
jgi:hypothetical protein